MEEITANELKTIIDSGGPRPVLVDVREAFEVMAGSLPYNHHIPMGAFVERFREIDRDADIVVYCRTGSRSASAVRYLMAQGYPRVRNLAGGIVAYSAVR